MERERIGMTESIAGRIRVCAAASLLAAAALITSHCGEAPPEVPPSTAEPDAAPAPMPVLSEAEAAAQAGQYDAAVSIIEEILSADSNNIEALRLLARVRTASGDLSGSAQVWQRIYGLDPYDPDAAYEVGSEMAEKGNWRGVRSTVTSLEAAGKADARHYLLAGRADMELGYLSEAEKYLLRAGDLELAQSLLGKLYYDRGDLDSAEKAFSRALELDESNYSANLHMGYIKYHGGKYRSAIRYYEAAHRLEPEDPLACLSLAAAHEKAGNRTLAVEYYRKGLKLRGLPSQERRKVYTTTARLLLESGRLDEVLELSAAGAKEFADAGGIYFYWGEALLKQGRTDEAKSKFKKAAEDPRWRDPALSRFHSIR
jgi:tetratricopeptide (TPR) repeat protein